MEYSNSQQRHALRLVPGSESFPLKRFFSFFFLAHAWRVHACMRACVRASVCVCVCVSRDSLGLFSRAEKFSQAGAGFG